MLSAISNGGLTHVRYEHRHRANKIEIVCPRCENKATATNPCWQEGIVTCIDLCPAWNKSVWEIRCTYCPYQVTGKNYDEIGSLFYQLESRGKTLWAWNKEHLEMLYKLLTEQNIDDHSYANMAVYARREWLLGTRKRAWAKLIEKTLNSKMR